MDRWIALSLDAAVVLIIVGCAVFAARRGFIRTVVQLAAYIGILIVASSASKAAAPVLYDRIVEPALFREGTRLIEQMPNASLAARSFALQRVPAGNPGLRVLLEEAGLPGMEALDGLFSGDMDMDALQAMLPEGFDLEDWLNRLQEGGQAMAEELIGEFLHTAVRPAAISALTVVCFAAVFFVLSLAANALLWMLGIIRHVPVIGGVNAALGALIGVAQGVLIVALAALLLQGILSLTGGQWWFFTNSIVQKTWLFHYFLSFPGILS